MPIYEVEAPDGRVLEIEGEKPPTAQELDDIFASVQPKRETSLIGEIEQGIQETPIAGSILRGGAEVGAGIGRTAESLINYFGVEPINAILSTFGSEKRLSDVDVSPDRQTFVKGLTGEILATTGETLPAAFGAAGALRGASALVPQTSTAGAVLSEVAKTTPAIETLSTIGGAAGQEIGEEVGGTTGRVVGGLSGGMAGGLAGSLKPDVIQAKKIKPLLDENNLPIPAFQSALQKKGLSVANIEDDLPVYYKGQNLDNYVDTIVKRKIKGGDKSGGLAEFTLDNRGRIVDDDIAKTAVKNGFRPNDVQAAKVATPSSKKAMADMLRIKRKELDISSYPKRPTDVVGDHLYSRYSFVKSNADDLRKQLDAMARKPSKEQIPGALPAPGLGGLKINTGKIEDTVIQELSDLEIDIPPEILSNTTKLADYLKSDDAFMGSLVSANPSSKKVIKEVLDLLSEPVAVDARRAHFVKRQIQEMIDFEKLPNSGLTKSGERFANAIRDALNESVREVSPRYAEINDKLSASIRAMEDLKKAVGPSVKLDKKGGSEILGQVLRGLTSQNKGRINLENAAGNIDKTAKQLGANFDVDVRDLVVFGNTLDDRFGSSARSGFQGQIEQAQAAEAMRRGAAGVVDFVGQKVVEKVGKRFGPDDEKAFNAMQKILMRD